MTEQNPQKLPPVAHSSLLAGGLTGFEGVTVVPFEARVPIEEAAGNFYRNIESTFAPGEAHNDPIELIQQPIESGNATVTEAAEHLINNGSANFDEVEAARALLRHETDMRFSDNGGDGDRVVIERNNNRMNILRDLQSEFVRAKVPGWDATPERRILANGWAEAAGEPIPFPQEYSQASEASVTPDMEIAPAPGNKLENIDPRIESLVENADWLNDRDKEEAIREARRLSGYDGMKNRVITRMNDGQTYWAKEYPTVFTFDGNLRGLYEDYPDDRRNQTAAQAMSGPGDKETHVIIETDDGHVYLFRRTSDPDVHAAAKQTFEVTSTRFNAGNDSGKALSKKIDQEQLKDVVVMPGHPLALARDEETGRQLHTKGNVVRITSVAKTETVHPDHPHLKQEERFRDAPARFLAAMELAKKQQVSADIGPLAVARS